MIFFLFYRVKSLSKSGNSKKDQASFVPLIPSAKESLSTFTDETESLEASRRNVEAFAYNSSAASDRNTAGSAPSYAYSGREDWSSGLPSEREKVEAKTVYGSSSSNQLYSSVQNSFDGQDEEKVTKVSPPRRKAPREEKVEKKMGWSRKNISEGQTIGNNNKQQNEQEAPFSEGEINALLEVHIQALLFYSVYFLYGAELSSVN